jgi:hypothetical protein
MTQKVQIEARGHTETTVTHEASIWVSYDTQTNPVKVVIFGKEYFMNYASIGSTWESDKGIPTAYLQISYVSILKNGKAGEKYHKRTFNPNDIGKYILGEEDTFREMWKQYYKTAEKVVQEKAVA